MGMSAAINVPPAIPLTCEALLVEDETGGDQWVLMFCLATFLSKNLWAFSVAAVSAKVTIPGNNS